MDTEVADSDDVGDEEVLAEPEPLFRADGSPQAAAGDPYPMTLPFRAEDLRPREMWEKSSSEHGGSGPCHGEGCANDIHAVRWAESTGSWVYTRAGTSGTAVGNNVGFGKPVYAVSSGEVVACWQNYPDTPTTDQDGTECQCNPSTGGIDCGTPVGAGWVPCNTVMRSGGNALVVLGDDGSGVAYAHFQQGSIPNELCPNNTSTQVFPTDISSPCEGCAPNEYLTCPPGGAGTDCGADDRPYVDAGDFIGRVGNSSTALPHIHIEANEYESDGNDNFSEQPGGLDSRFSSSWWQVRQASGPGQWGALVGTSLKFLWAWFGGQTLVLWPGKKQEKTYTPSTRLADYDGDGDDDLLCHATGSGTLYLDFASLGVLNGTDAPSMPNGWCKNSGGTQRIHTGDFNADGRSDILCHDMKTGVVWVDHANAQGRFGGTDDSKNAQICNGDAQEPHIGDFDGDGRDDLYCHEYATSGSSRVYFSGASLFPEWVPVAGGWCKGAHQRVYVGKFNADALEDRLCHDSSTGQIWIDYASAGNPVFAGTNQTAGPWCHGAGHRLYVGQVNGGSMDDLVCHDSDAASGKIWVDYDSLTGSNWSGDPDGWCTGPAERLRLGDVNGDGRDDLVCFDIETGTRSVDYAIGSGNTNFFTGPDWSTAGAWCYASDQALH